jgi:hypothetical protein
MPMTAPSVRRASRLLASLDALETATKILEKLATEPDSTIAFGCVIGKTTEMGATPEIFITREVAVAMVDLARAWIKSELRTLDIIGA